MWNDIGRGPEGTASFSVGLAFKCRGVAGKVVGNDILRRQTRVFGPFRAPRISSKECRVARHSWMAGPSLFTRVSSCLLPLALVFFFSFNQVPFSAIESISVSSAKLIFSECN